MRQFEINRDKNGNKICTLKVDGEKSFSVQTNGNMPRTHQSGVCIPTPHEFKQYIISFGTDKQKEIVEREL